jgi:vacuolar-type H+-ATPase subunit H
LSRFGRRSSSFSDLGSRIDQLLRTAVDQAEEIVAEARQEADRIIAEAQEGIRSAHKLDMTRRAGPQKIRQNKLVD